MVVIFHYTKLCLTVVVRTRVEKTTQSRAIATRLRAKNGHKLHQITWSLKRCISLIVQYMESHFAYLQNGPVSIEVQRWFNLQWIVPKIFTFKSEARFRGLQVQNPTKSTQVCKICQM